MNRLALRLAAGSSRTGLSRTSVNNTPAWLRLRQCVSGIRTIHNRLELPYKIEDGMREFLNPAGLKMIALDYQQGLLDRLNEEVKGTSLQNKSVAQTVIDAAQDPNLILTFNYASEALNNSFFLQSLIPPKDGQAHNEDDIDTVLSLRIRYQFGSLEQLKSVFSASVLGMFGAGWVWLVSDQYGQLAALPTFGTGTLLVRSQERVLQGPDVIVGEELHEPAPLTSSEPPPPPSSPASGLSRGPRPLHPSTPSRTYSTPSADFSATSVHSPDPSMINPANQDPTKFGEKLFPLMCISVHEHAWVGAGYGVWGKEEYVKRFWSVVNWEKISRDYALYGSADAVSRKRRT